MKINLTLLIIGFVLLGLPKIVQGQQQAMYTQYMFNGLAINPAYAGTSESINISTLARWQWAGVEGAPVTTTVSAHAPIQRKNIGVGLTISRDEIAVTSQTNVFGAYAYRVLLGPGYLSMGLQAGFTSFNGNYNEVYTMNPDITFQDQYNQFLPNMGAGAFYYTSLFYVGLSAPMMVKNRVQNNGFDTFTQQRHYFFTSGMVFKLSDQIKLKPNVLVKMVDGAPLAADINLNVLFKELFWVGASVRLPESVSFIAELNLNQRLRVGYAYDHIVDQTLRNAAVSSHEILLNYQIPLIKNAVVTPRYF